MSEQQQEVPEHIRAAIRWAATVKPQALRVANLPPEVQAVLGFSEEDGPEKVQATLQAVLAILGVYARQVGLHQPVIVEPEVDVVWTAMCREHLNPEHQVFSAAVYLWTCGQAQRAVIQQVMGPPPGSLLRPNGNVTQLHDPRRF